MPNTENKEKNEDFTIMQANIKTPDGVPVGTITPSIIKKLAKIRKAVIELGINKSGTNTQIKSKYFELSDFLPSITRECEKNNVLPVVTFSMEDKNAYLTLYDADSPGCITFNCPIENMVNTRGQSVQTIQMLGAVQTYARRYLYITAFEITTSEILDAIQDFSPEKKALIFELESYNTNFDQLLVAYNTTIADITIEQLEDACNKKRKQKEKNSAAQPSNNADDFDSKVN